MSGVPILRDEGEQKEPLGLSAEHREGISGCQRLGAPRPMHPKDRSTSATIVAESQALRRALDLGRRFAPLRLPVLLVGETGTGKEVLAQAIHRWSGISGELVSVDCGALSPGMAVVELFGHRRGAYTSAVDSVPGLFEQAHRGTLFLDELSSMGPEGQAALLRVLETGEARRVGERVPAKVSVRLVAATQEQPGKGIREGAIRADLYQRLAGGIIYLPPLRERMEDVWPMAVNFARQDGYRVADAAKAVLTRYQWPGNAREIRHVVSRAGCLSDSNVLSAAAIAEAIDMGRVGPGPGRLEWTSALEEREQLESLCREHQGDVERLTAVLGISRATLYRRLQRAGLRLR